MFICQNLIAVKSVTFNMWKGVKIAGKQDGDPMRLTTQRIKEIIVEELEKINEMGSYMGRSPQDIEAEMKSIKAQIAQLKDPKAISDLKQYLNDLLIDLADAM